MTTFALDVFRVALQALDPATLTGADKRAMLDVVQAAMAAGGAVTTDAGH